MTDFASLGLDIDASSADRAAESLDKLAEAGQKVEESFEGVGSRLAEQGITMEEMNRRSQAFMNTQNAQAGATTKQSTELQKYLQQLKFKAETLGMTQAQLMAYRGVQLGLAEETSGLTNEQLMSAAAHLQAIDAYDKGTKSLGEMTLGTQRTRQGILGLARDILTGNFRQIPSRLANVAGSMGLITTSTFGVIGAIGAVVGAIGVMAKAFNDGQREVIAFNNAIIASGNFAGVTRQQMTELANQMAETGRVTISQAKDIVTALIQSGRVGNEGLAEIIEMSTRFGAVTGATAEKLKKDLVSMFEDPAKAAQELNRTMHFLTPTEREHIENLQAQNRLGEAQLLLAQRFNEAIPKQVENLGFLDQAWQGLKNTLSSVWDTLRGIGRDKTAEEKIKAIQDMLRLYGGGLSEEKRANAVRELAELERQVAEEKAKAARDAEVARTNAAQNAAFDLIKQTSETARLRSIENDIQKIKSFNAETDNQAVDKANALVVKERERLNLLEAMSAERRAVQQEEFNLVEKHLDFQEKAAIESLKFLERTGAITKERRDFEIFRQQQHRDEMRLIFLEEQAGLKTLTDLEKAKYDTEVFMIKRNMEARTASHERGLMEAEHRLRVAQQTAQAEADARGRAEFTSSTMDAVNEAREMVQALEFEKRALGKTREEVNFLAIEYANLAINKKQAFLNELEGSVADPESDPNIARLREELELLRQAQQLRQDIGPNAVQEATYQAQIEALQEAREQMFITNQEYDMLELEARANHEWKLTGIMNQGMTERFKFAQMSWGQQTKHIIGMLADMTAGAALHNKELFEVNKVASIGVAIVKGIEAVQSAYAFGSTWGGPAGGAALAAIAAAATAVNVAAIANTKFGSMSGQSFSGGGGGGPSRFNATPEPSIPITPPERATQTVTVFLEGEVFNKKMLRDMFDRLNEENDDGARFVIG